MNYGLYLAASGMLTNLHRQDVAANNLANASTNGFKRDLAMFYQRDAEAIEDHLSPDMSQRLMDRLGGGAMVQPTRVDQSNGSLLQTGDDMNLAIHGRGFFKMNVQQGDQTVQRLSRDGRLRVASDGRLVGAITDYTLLDMNNQPIIVDRTKQVTIDEHGNVRQGSQAIARISLVDVPDDANLRHIGNGLYDPGYALESATSTTAASGRILQGSLEQSNVDPIRQMLQMIKATSAVQRNGQLIKYHDMVMDKAVNTLGRVA